MLSAVGGIAENLVAAAIGGGMAAGWRILAKRRRFKDVRAMWGPFLGPDVSIVLGALSAETLSEDLPHRVPRRHRAQAVQLLPYVVKHLREQEPSGLMGKGDHDAVVAIQTGLAQAGRTTVLPVRSDARLGDHRRDNLIVVGGLDVNPVTKDVLDALKATVTIARDESDRNFVQDLRDGRRWVMAATKTETRDYGFLVKAPSPYRKGRYVVVVAGVYGYGCWAAADVAVNFDAEMAELSRKFPRGFECVVSYRRTGKAGNTTETSDIVLSRPLAV